MDQQITDRQLLELILRQMHEIRQENAELKQQVVEIKALYLQSMGINEPTMNAASYFDDDNSLSGNVIK